MRQKITAAILFGTALCTTMANAAVKLPHFVTDSMVVQQNSLFRITGSASGGNVMIAPSWTSEVIETPVSPQGHFSAEFSTPSAGGPYTISLTDADGTATLHEIWSGEVWLCSGQSNMEMPVGGWGQVMNFREEIANATHPAIHLLQIKKQTAFTPQADAEVNMGGWRTCSPQTVEEFSSIAYFFARRISEELGVHVGVIDCTWGGTPAEAWTSVEGVATIQGFEEEMQLLKEGGSDANAIYAAYDRMTAELICKAAAGNPDFDPSVFNADGIKVNVPAVIETHLGSFDGIFWLQKRIEIPSDMAGKQLYLELGMIDDEDITYFNGTEIARGSGYNVPRHYTVPAELVKPGEAIISVKVTDFQGEGGIWGEPGQVAARSSDGNKEIPLAGEWSCSIVADFSKIPRRPASPASSSFPGVLYNAMFAPLKGIPVKGVLWYQGCANVGRDVQYAPLFRQMIADWRALRNQPDMPFYFMQLAGYLTPQPIQPESQWAALRNAQAEAMLLPGTRMATAIDIGNPNDIHPKNKQEAARRFALIALRDSYGRHDVVSSAPILLECKSSGTTAELTFDGTLQHDGNRITGFIAQLANGQWVLPSVTMSGNSSLSVSADGKIVGVRYNWADYPDGNLRGKTGLPVAPFAATPQ